MGEVDLAGFQKALRGAVRVGVDTAVWIYHLEDIRPYSSLTVHLLSEAAAGTLSLILSAINVAEVLAGPWRAGNNGLAERIEAALGALAGVAFDEVTWSVAVRAARITGETKLPMPDALIIASALENGAELLVTNDAAWSRARSLQTRVLQLADYASG